MFVVFLLIDYTDAVWNDLDLQNPDHSSNIYPQLESTSAEWGNNPVASIQASYGLEQLGLGE